MQNCCVSRDGHVMSYDVTVCSGDGSGEQLCNILEAVFLHELKNKVCYAWLQDLPPSPACPPVLFLLPPLPSFICLLVSPLLYTACYSVCNSIPSCLELMVVVIRSSGNPQEWMLAVEVPPSLVGKCEMSMGSLKYHMFASAAL